MYSFNERDEALHLTVVKSAITTFNISVNIQIVNTAVGKYENNVVYN